MINHQYCLSKVLERLWEQLLYSIMWFSDYLSTLLCSCCLIDFKHNVFVILHAICNLATTYHIARFLGLGVHFPSANRQSLEDQEISIQEFYSISQCGHGSGVACWTWHMKLTSVEDERVVNFTLAALLCSQKSGLAYETSRKTWWIHWYEAYIIWNVGVEKVNGFYFSNNSLYRKSLSIMI